MTNACSKVMSKIHLQYKTEQWVLREQQKISDIISDYTVQVAFKIKLTTDFWHNIQRISTIS